MGNVWSAAVLQPKSEGDRIGLRECIRLSRMRLLGHTVPVRSKCFRPTLSAVDDRENLNRFTLDAVGHDIGCFRYHNLPGSFDPAFTTEEWEIL